MPTTVRLSLHAEEHGKVTPLELLRDFADVKTGWSYLEEDSRHYADLKDAPGLVLRHRIDPSTYVDLGFVGTSSDPSSLELAVLDRPDAESTLSADDRAQLLDTFLDAMRDYLSGRPDHVSLEVDQNENVSS